MSQQPAAGQPLDEVMLAMDVVDTLRNRSRLVERELAADDRDAELKEKLRRIYAAQGIEVSDQVLEEGVRALREDRFSYRPPAGGIQVRLARLYVSRGRWGRWFFGGAAALVAMVAAYFIMVVAPGAGLPGKIEAAYKQLKQVAHISEAAGRQQADELFRAAVTAAEDGDRAKASELLEAMELLRDRLGASYRLEVVNRPGERSGVWRVPDANTGARNYYIIVEAIGPDGRPVAVPVRSEETGRVEVVTTWGLRVGEDVFTRVARDKQDDGIIQNRVFGTKQSGSLEPEYRFATTGAAITAW